jgi:YHS domain-containing protein
MKNIFLVFLGACLLNSVHAQDAAVLRKQQFNLDNAGIGISGYDPVAYFSLNKAVKGNKENAAVYQGVTYYFSSVENKEAFAKSPVKYEPVYGGWCAFAMGSKGEKVEVDPKTFKIVDGKLNLFYNKFFNNTLTSWNKDEANLKKTAAANWNKIYH